jgi:outer membrane protein OmpA-like peptidoglycan-associated protein/opacity protein-like surface antigen
MFVTAAAAVALSAATFGSAHAQSALNWTGPYVGLSAGGSWAHADATIFNSAGVSVAHASNLRPAGPMLGVLGGYNFMVPWNLVVGVAADAYGADISSNKTFGAINSSVKTNALGSGRLVLGYPVQQFMPYLTGGVAWSHTRASLAVAGVGASGSETKVGWTAGGGVDYALGSLVGITNLVLGVEYRYSELGHVHIGGGTLGSASIQHLRSNTALVNLTYHFNMTPPPAPVVAPPPPPPAAVAPQKQMFIVFFEFDKSSLTADGRRVVDAAAAAFKSGKSGVAIAGYTDLSGTQQYNLALSKRRADTVKQGLVRDGVPAAAIDVKWFGKQNPRVPTADGVREPQNRRVEITM